MTSLRRDDLRRAAFWTAVVALAAAAVFFFIASLSWFDRPYPGFKLRLDRTVELQLPPHSTGAKAGLMPGDRVLSVDGRPLGHPRSLYDTVAIKPLGTAVTYDLLRSLPDGRQLRLKKTIPTQAHDWKQWCTTFLALWLTGVCFLVLGAAVSALKPGDRLARAGLACHFVAAAACLGIFDQSSTYLFPFQDPARLLLWVSAVCFTNLALQFPRRYAWLEGPRRAMLVAGLSLTVVLVAGYAADRWSFWITFAHLGYLALGEVVLLANSLWTSLSSKSSPSERGQGKTLLVGTLVSTTPTLIVPQAHSLGIHLNMEGLENVAMPLWALAISYAIIRHQLFDLSPLLRRSLTYLLSAGILTLLYALSVGAAETVIGKHTTLPGVLGTTLVALTFAPVRDRTKAWLDSRFYRSPYQFDEVIASFTRTAQDTADPGVLVEAYLQTLDQALAPTQMALLLSGAGLPPLVGRGVSRADLPFLEDLVAADMPPAAHQAGWNILALTVHEQRLGHALFGPKKSGLPYTELDRALLRELTQLLSVWLNLFERFEQAHLQGQEIEALKRSEALQGQFLNVVSHELKIPLSVILGALNLLKRHESTLDAKTISQHDRIRRSLTNLIGLVGDLLNAGQLQGGHFRLRTRTLDLAIVAQEALAEMRGLADQKDHRLALELSGELPPVSGDRTRLEQVFRNLIHNAIRYTPPQGRIDVRLGLEGRRLRCEVRDNGPGIASEALPLLFQRFSQVHAELTDRDQGVGLGLFIARAIVEAHGGEIGVASAPGQGSTFWFTVPLVEATTTVPPAPVSEPC